MNVVILGAGRVGGKIAEMLVGESNDITVVDTDGNRLRELQSHLDLRTVRGSASHPPVLREAGCEDAEMVVAVTAIDEVNLVACKICGALFNVPTKIARIRAAEITGAGGLFSSDNFHIDHAFCPEEIVTEAIVGPIRHPGSVALHHFAGGRVALAVMRADRGAPICGRAINEIQRATPDLDFRIVAVYRDTPILPDGGTMLADGDEVFVVAAAGDIQKVLDELNGEAPKVKRVIIAGGGNIGRRLASALEDECEVKVIEGRRERCAALSQMLERALILRGDATDETLLQEEGAADADMFCAVTNDDEDNIMSALLAKRLGARSATVLINRATYADLLLAGRQIDIAISPSQVTIGSLLAHLRHGDVAQVHSLRRGAAEALEAVVHGDAKTSQVIGRRAADIAWPAGAKLGAIVRGERVLIAHGDTMIESKDHLIIFLAGRREVGRVEKLLAVNLDYF